MKLCVFGGAACVICGAPMVNKRQVCGSWKAEAQTQFAIGGPGTELRKLIGNIGIVSTPDCSCDRVAAEMDSWGADECERPERIEYVLAAMRDNAAKRGLPFFDVAGRMLIRRAIKNARKALQNQP